MRHDNPVYAAMVYSMDESLGKIVDALQAQGVLDNTVIIFFFRQWWIVQLWHTGKAIGHFQFSIASR
jgi:Arylsulfatase A and related enzymes